MTRVGSRLVLELQEYGQAEPVLRELAEGRGLSAAMARDLFARANERIQRHLQLDSPPIQVTGNFARATDVAGIIRVTAGVELEVCPKYLNHATPTWREDLLFLASVSRHGRLLTEDRIGSRRASSDDFATLLAHVIVRLYADNHRRPLRTYQVLRHTEFGCDGEADPIDIALPQEDGYQQAKLELTRKNKYNAVIAAAIDKLAGDVRDPELGKRLHSVRARLGGQAPYRSLGRAVLPSRSRNWQPLVDLSLELLRGGTQAYGGRTLGAPGFMVDTWRTWEDLIGVALRLRVGGQLRLQHPFVLGSRRRWAGGVAGQATSVRVRPDAVVVREKQEGPYKHVVVDAKYKTRNDRGELRISESDLYEALAFAAATPANRIVLLYPHPAEGTTEGEPRLGAVKTFEEITVGAQTVIGATVQVEGIGRSRALGTFASRLQEGVLGLAG